MMILKDNVLWGFNVFKGNRIKTVSQITIIIPNCKYNLIIYNSYNVKGMKL